MRTTALFGSRAREITLPVSLQVGMLPTEVSSSAFPEKQEFCDGRVRQAAMNHLRAYKQRLLSPSWGLG